MVTDEEGFLRQIWKIHPLTPIWPRFSELGTDWDSIQFSVDETGTQAILALLAKTRHLTVPFSLSQLSDPKFTPSMLNTTWGPSEIVITDTLKIHVLPTGTAVGHLVGFVVQQAGYPFRFFLTFFSLGGGGPQP